ncbi:hypothetical protein BGM09_34255 [Streptomyces sp. CBMA29]|nr:hypothetical protein [Streptomyces sp. CBMA29]
MTETPRGRWALRDGRSGKVPRGPLTAILNQSPPGPCVWRPGGGQEGEFFTLSALVPPSREPGAAGDDPRPRPMDSGPGHDRAIGRPTTQRQEHIP